MAVGTAVKELMELSVQKMVVAVVMKKGLDCRKAEGLHGEGRMAPSCQHKLLMGVAAFPENTTEGWRISLGPLSQPHPGSWATDYLVDFRTPDTLTRGLDEVPLLPLTQKRSLI